jgi:hypothetical protein
MILHGITLPDDLTWDDEWAWTPYTAEADHATDGTQIIERSQPRQAGRPVTLTGAQNRAWLDRATLQALHAALDQNAMTLTLGDGRELTVGWRHEDTPIEATEVRPYAGWWHCTLRLRTV